MEGLHLSATAHVKLTKLDELGNAIAVETQEVTLTDKEAEELWLLQQQA